MGRTCGCNNAECIGSDTGPSPRVALNGRGGLPARDPGFHDPDLMRLRFSMDSVESSPVGTPDWRAANVAEIYHRSGAASGSATSRFVRQASRMLGSSWNTPTHESAHRVGARAGSEGGATRGGHRTHCEPSQFTESSGEDCGCDSRVYAHDHPGGSRQYAAGGGTTLGSHRLPIVYGPTTVYDKPKCCPLIFGYPLSIKMRRRQLGPARLPQFGHPKQKKHCARFSFSFSYKAAFKPAPFPCRCRCCEFGQDLLASIVVLRCRDGSFSGMHRDSGAGGEDCTWYYTWLSKNPMSGQTKSKGRWYTRTGPRNRPPEPYPGSVLSGGPYCPGTRKSLPSLVDGADPAPADPGYPAGFDCGYTGTDTPGIVVPPNCTFLWMWSGMGYIRDVCRGGRSERKSFTVIMKGSTNSQGRGDEPEFEVIR